MISFWQYMIVYIASDIHKIYCYHRFFDVSLWPLSRKLKYAFCQASTLCYKRERSQPTLIHLKVIISNVVRGKNHRISRDLLG